METSASLLRNHLFEALHHAFEYFPRIQNGRLESLLPYLRIDRSRDARLDRLAIENKETPAENQQKDRNE